ELVEAPRPHQERGDDLASVALLSGPGDDTGLDEIDDWVGEHLRMDPEVALVAEGECRRRRDGTDAELERRAIGDEVGDVLPDLPLDFFDRANGMFVRGDVDLNGEIDVADVDEAVAKRARHRAVEL